ncbi:hypothetical protein NDU88_004824 [Pleurodeles waltl]|uniref:Uncharacterized protein n=1 Tax=Pleurodeles waltl TaxID=8319 RepID=A0AAV7SJX1_PLEWA|nr:hypothetical protein NDU88_004824 [Pleurodeles waltl]
MGAWPHRQDVGRIVREVRRGLQLSDPTDPCLGAAGAATVCQSGGTTVAECAGGSADPRECKTRGARRSHRAWSPRERAGDSGSREARPAAGFLGAPPVPAEGGVSCLKSAGTNAGAESGEPQGKLAVPPCPRDNENEEHGLCPWATSGGSLAAPSPRPSVLLHFTFRLLLLACSKGEEDVGQQGAAVSVPREKKRPHRTLKYGTGPAGSTEWLGLAYGVEPPPEGYRTPGGALQSRSGTDGNCSEVGSD